MTFKKLSIIILLSILITGCTTRTKNFESGSIPTAQEVDQNKTKETKQILQQYANEQGFTLSQKGATYNRVEKIVRKLEKASGLTSTQYPLYIADAGSQKNAFAFNSNTIVVFQALADAVPVDEQLAVILAHEVSHILALHTEDDTEQSRSTAVSIGATLLGTAVAIATGISDLGDMAAQGTHALGTGAFVLSYGRAQEYEADHIGLLLMAKAGYDPQNAITVWSNADTILGQGSDNAFLSSHPTHGNRLDRLNKDMPLALEYYNNSKAK